MLHVSTYICKVQTFLHTNDSIQALISLTLVTDTFNILSLDSTPTLQAIRKFIVPEIAADWSLVAVYLGLESSAITIIAIGHPQDCEHACMDVFDRWLSWELGTGERDRNWHTVFSAVEDAGHKAHIQQLKTEIFPLQ